MQAGVSLVTVSDGPIDWNDFSGRMVFQMKQEGKHQFLTDLSRNTARGQIKMARGGGRNARPPWGYDRMLIDEHGQHRMRVPHGEQVPKPKGWRSQLVLSETDAATKVRWMFATYAKGRVSLSELAGLLASKGVRSPEGKRWTKDMVRSILRNPIYTGDSVWGKRSTGKYHQAIGGEIVRVQGPRSVVTRHEEASWIVVKDAHEAIVDRKTFDKVQKRMLANRAYTGPQQETYVLKGICHCGHCGEKMHGWRKTWKNRKGKVVVKEYVCQTYQRLGKRGGCGHHAINEEAMAGLLVRKLRDTIFAGGKRELFRERILERFKAEAKAAPEAGAKANERLAALDKQIDQAADRLMRAPDDLVDVLAPKLTAMRDERRRLAAQVDADSRAAAPKPASVDPDAIVDRLWRLAQELDKADPKALRELFRRMVARIDLWFDREQSGKKEFARVARGVVELRPDELFEAGLPNDFGLAEDTSTCFR